MSDKRKTKKEVPKKIAKKIAKKKETGLAKAELIFLLASSTVTRNAGSDYCFINIDKGPSGRRAFFGSLVVHAHGVDYAAEDVEVVLNPDGSVYSVEFDEEGIYRLINGAKSHYGNALCSSCSDAARSFIELFPKHIWSHYEDLAPAGSRKAFAKRASELLFELVLRPDIFDKKFPRGEVLIP